MSDHQRFQQVVQRIDPQNILLRFWSLEVGVSARVTALEIERPGGQRQKMVVRQHGLVDLERNPRIAADEFRLLEHLHTAGIPVPQPIYVDKSGDIFPTPYLVVTFVEGQSTLNPARLTDGIQQLANTLAAIHRVDSASLTFLPEKAAIYAAKFSQHPATLDDSLDEGRIRAALESAWPLPNMNRTGLLHGDFWPGNILWHDRRLAAVIDWEDAALGDPLDDLANTRLEMLWAYGVDAMQQLTQAYQTAMPALDYANLPYWDLCAALRPASKLGTWGLDAATEHTMRERHHWFVTRAFELLPGK